MKAIRIFFITVMLASVTTSAHAENTCGTAIRGVFQKASAQIRTIREKIDAALLKKKGRAQSEQVSELIEKNVSRDIDEWLEDLIVRMHSNKTYPSLEEMLAFQASKSPTFKSGLIDFLQNHGSLRYKYLAYFREPVLLDATVGKVGEALTIGDKINNKGGAVKTGFRFKPGFETRPWEFWDTRLRVPKRRPFTQNEFATFMMEISNAMFRAANQEYEFSNLGGQLRFANLWIRSWGDVRLTPENWNVMKHFAERLQREYSEEYKNFLKGVAHESYETVPPDAAYLREFYYKGIWQASLDRLNAIIVKRSLKGAFDQDAIFSAEVQKLTHAVRFVSRPIYQALSLYLTVETVREVDTYLKEREALRKFQEKANDPAAYDPTSQEQKDDAIEELNEQLMNLTKTRAALERDIAKSTSAAQKSQLQSELNRVKQKIENIQKMQLDLLNKKSDVTPSSDN